MKDKMKNTLEHEVELLGRSISVLAIAGLLVVGGASAALLTSFGTIDGEAEVDQAFQVGQDGLTEGTADLSYSSFGSELTAGDTVVDGPYRLSNNQDSAYSPTVTTTLDRGDDEVVDSTTGTSVDWTYNDDYASVSEFDDASDGDDVGLETTYVDAFHEAGHDFEDVETTSEDASEDSGSESLTVGDSSDNYDTISAALEDAEDDDTVFVHSGEGPDNGEYNGFTVDTKGVTVASNGAQVEVGSNSQVDIDAADVTIEGFEIYPEDSEVASNNLVDVQTDSSFTIRNNKIRDLEVEKSDGGPSGTAIYLGTDSTGTIEDNTIESNFAGIGGTEDFSGNIDYNYFVDNDEAIGVGSGQAFSTGGNVFESNEASFRVHYDDSDSSVDAGDNFFHTPYNIDYNGNGDTEVSASYKELSDFEVGADSTEEFGVVNELDLRITTTDFTLETTIDSEDNTPSTT